MAVIRVQPEPFDLSAEIAAMTEGRTDVGGIGCFVGNVRGGDVAALELEHFPGLTERAMAAIAAEAETRWSLLGCTLIHRIGRLAPGDGIVLVLAASRHRQAALDATGFLIDWLKTRAPFWKKEFRTDGGHAWVEARDADDEAAARW